jgi:hypothetical protein
MEDELNLTEPSPNLAEVCGEIIAITPPRTFFVSAAPRFLAPPSSLTLVRRLEVFAVFVFFFGMMFSSFCRPSSSTFWKDVKEALTSPAFDPPSRVARQIFDSLLFELQYLCLSFLLS